MEATEAKLSFESALTQLETIVESMESGDVPLAELLAKFEEGNKLLKVCEGRLKDAVAVLRNGVRIFPTNSALYRLYGETRGVN